MIALLFTVVIGLMVACPAMSIDVSSGVNVGELAERAMIECGYSLKAFSLSCGYADSSTLSRAFHGLAPLDLWHLRWAPLQWWFLFLAKIGSAVIQQHLDDLRVEFKMARANIREYEETKRRA